MARSVNMDALNQKIEKAEQEVVKAKKAYDMATSELKKLLDKRDAVRSQELLKAVADSPLTYAEIIAMIKTGGKNAEDEE